MHIHSMDEHSYCDPTQCVDYVNVMWGLCNQKFDVVT